MGNESVFLCGGEWKSFLMNLCDKMNEFHQVSALQIVGEHITGVLLPDYFPEYAGEFPVLPVVQGIKRLRLEDRQ